MNTSQRVSSPLCEDDGIEEYRTAKRKRLNPAIEVGLVRDASDRSPASFVGSASGIYFIRSVYGALDAKPPLHRPNQETPGSNIVPREDDRLNLNSNVGSS